MPRTVTLVVVDSSEEPIGALTPFEVSSPWWPDVAPVVAGAQKVHGVDVTVLRLIDAKSDPADPYGMGGSVTYTVETDIPPQNLLPWSGSIPDDPRRASWARPGGPVADLAWADAVLGSVGRRRSGRAEQIKTWNLSSVWRLPTQDGDTWLKAVPSFFAHEGLLMRAVGPPTAPALLGTQPGRALMADVPGENLFGAPVDLMLEMVDLLVSLQARWIDRVPELLTIGLPDWRADQLGPALAHLVERCANEIEIEDRYMLDRLVSGLPNRLSEIDGCGLPPTLVHGDFHPGNFRGLSGSLVLLDWGDSFVGHPLFDRTAMLERAGAGKKRVAQRWIKAWAAAVPGSEPARAAKLLAPVAPLRNALVYRSFLDQIESSEQRYHAGDVPKWLAVAANEVRNTSEN